MLYKLSKVYSDLLAVKADHSKISTSWSWRGREQNAFLCRECKFKTWRVERCVQEDGRVVVTSRVGAVTDMFPVVLLADHLYANLSFVDGQCGKTRDVMDSLKGCYKSRGSTRCTHVGGELDEIVKKWGVQPGKLLTAAITAIETDIAALGYGVFSRCIETEKGCVERFLRLASAGGEADKLDGTTFASAALMRKSVRAGVETVERFFGSELDARIDAAKAEVAKLERLREERDSLRSMGKRTYADLGPWIAAEGVLKRAKSV
jgi:hypothetical protein